MYNWVPSSLWSDFDGSYSCKVLIHDQCIGEGDGNTKRFARKNAASAALEFARANNQEIKQICTCTGKKPVDILAELEADD